MKNYVVIGGSSGIGEAVALNLDSSGHHVRATYCQNPVLKDHTNIHYQYLNVLEDISLVDLPEKIHGLVYCPGSINLKPFHRIKPSDFENDFKLQVSGAVKVIQYLLPRLKKAESSSIILFSTVAVNQGFNFHSQVSSSKGAVEGLVKALSAEFSPTIRVNCIAPSLTDTPLAAKLLSSEEKREANSKRHPLKRIGTPQDIAQAAIFLLGDTSSWITGQIIHVDGGMSSIKL
ncbi:MAG: SDR family oxidoreductase [Crocinitomicaceae bacterium]|nr:SDR family oxidoreductase [Crocinitomicaceae bacterium]